MQSCIQGTYTKTDTDIIPAVPIQYTTSKPMVGWVIFAAVLDITELNEQAF